MYKSLAIHARSTFWTNKETYEEVRVIDSNDLAKEIELQCNQLETQGYSVLCITPITSAASPTGTGIFKRKA
jgi:hypothetical protein